MRAGLTMNSAVRDGRTLISSAICPPPRTHPKAFVALCAPPLPCRMTGLGFEPGDSSDRSGLDPFGPDHESDDIAVSRASETRRPLCLPLAVGEANFFVP